MILDNFHFWYKYTTKRPSKKQQNKTKTQEQNINIRQKHVKKQNFNGKYYEHICVRYVYINSSKYMILLYAYVRVTPYTLQIIIIYIVFVLFSLIKEDSISSSCWIGLFLFLSFFYHGSSSSFLLFLLIKLNNLLLRKCKKRETVRIQLISFSFLRFFSDND